jgi:hypothetical protein
MGEPMTTPRIVRMFSRPDEEPSNADDLAGSQGPSRFPRRVRRFSRVDESAPGQDNRDEE